MSDKKLHVVTVVGTRPEIIRLSRVVSRLNESTQLNIHLFIQARIMIIILMKFLKN